MLKGAAEPGEVLSHVPPFGMIVGTTPWEVSSTYSISLSSYVLDVKST
jgi:hypothetical protein